MEYEFCHGSNSVCNVNYIYGLNTTNERSDHIGLNVSYLVNFGLKNEPRCHL